MRRLKIIETEYSKASEGHYVPGVIHGDTLYISGQLSIDPANGKKPEAFDHEVRQALDNVDAVLRAAGLGRRSLILCRAYIPSAEYWGDFNKAYAQWMGSHRCARVVIPTRELHHGCRVEIEAVAAIAP